MTSDGPGTRAAPDGTPPLGSPLGARLRRGVPSAATHTVAATTPTQLSQQVDRRTGSSHAYKDTGEAVQLNPLYEDFAGSGTQTVLFAGSPTTAYVIPLDDATHGALVERGGTTAIVTGPFDKQTVPLVISQLEAL